MAISEFFRASVWCSCWGILALVPVTSILCDEDSAACGIFELCGVRGELSLWIGLLSLAHFCLLQAKLYTLRALHLYCVMLFYSIDSMHVKSEPTEMQLGIVKSCNLWVTHD